MKILQNKKSTSAALGPMDSNSQIPLFINSIATKVLEQSQNNVIYIKSLHLFSRESSEKETNSLHIKLLLEGKISFGLPKKKKKICESSEMLNILHYQELRPTSEKRMFFSLICITPALSLHSHLFLRFFTYEVNKMVL